jgi:hypothetical protein
MTPSVASESGSVGRSASAAAADVNITAQYSHSHLRRRRRAIYEPEAANEGDEVTGLWLLCPSNGLAIEVASGCIVGPFCADYFPIRFQKWAPFKKGTWLISRLERMPLNQCAGCGHSPSGSEGKEKLLKCARCFQASYCSHTCQKLHWKSHHKRECGFFHVKQVSANTETDVNADLSEVD